MKNQLLIVRHAKSANTNAAPDHDRTLSIDGKNQAPHTALQIKSNQIKPDLVLCSDAQRTQETWELMEPIFGKTPIEFTRELYMASVDDVLRLIQAVPLSVNTLMILGHNPTSEALVEWLSTEILTIDTANAILLEGNLSWGDIANQKGNWIFKKQIRPD